MKITFKQAIREIVLTAILVALVCLWLHGKLESRVAPIAAIGAPKAQEVSP